jgi:hypothetical protein
MIRLVSPSELIPLSKINQLVLQTALSARIDIKGFFGEIANLAAP